MFNYERNGSFIVETDGLRIGHVFTIAYGSLGWIGLLIVRTEYRNRGVGRLLMQKAIDYLLSCGVHTIDLDAVPEVSGLYRQLGFFDRFDSLRFMGISRKASYSANKSASRMRERQIVEVAGFDARYFGADRTRVLRKLLEAHPQYCFVLHEDSDVTGYLMCRRAETGYNVGPFVCSSVHAAEELLSKCLDSLPSNAPVYAGVPAVNNKTVELLQGFGFKQYSKSIRMRMGRNLETERQSGIYAIGGPMKG
jgi:ribosomal protein S18 acetylase RimI-like enzyme